MYLTANLKTFIFLITFSLPLCINAFGQKLPNKQSAAVRPPSSIKIDGKALEWGNSYKAYNTATEMYYTLSNDDENLYLITHIDQKNAIFNRVLTGGMTIILKTKNEHLSLRYPAFKILPSFKGPKKGEVVSGKDDDPIIVDNNRVFKEEAKLIEITGLKDVDSVISIYNERGIRVASSFDAQQGYTYELAIPLKHLDLNVKKNQSLLISYQIIINGGKSKYPESRNISNLYEVTSASPTSDAELALAMESQRRMMTKMYATTDFSGEYTLAK